MIQMAAQTLRESRLAADIAVRSQAISDVACAAGMPGIRMPENAEQMIVDVHVFASRDDGA